MDGAAWFRRWRVTQAGGGELRHVSFGRLLGGSRLITVAATFCILLREVSLHTEGLKIGAKIGRLSLTAQTVS
jgi:hypothetical protein